MEDPAKEPISTEMPANQEPAAPMHVQPNVSTAAHPTPGATKDACMATWSVSARRKRLDMYIVMDANITLPYTGLWEQVTTGLQLFVRDEASQGIGVGLRYFGSVCDADPYNYQPTVEVGVLPDNETALVTSLKQRTTFSASPMLAALQGGLAHQVARAKDNPDTKQIVVLATDGVTQDLMCRYSLNDVVDAASDGFSGTPSVETYIIGFGTPDTMSTIGDDVLARFSPLESIAVAGGTRRAMMVKYGDDPEPVHAAMTTVRRMAQACDFRVPQDADPSNLNLVFYPTGQVPRVEDNAKCGQSSGFYFLPDDQTNIRLCPASCAPLQRNDYTGVWLGGCPTLRR
jgi:hypothetical protein